MDKRKTSMIIGSLLVGLLIGWIDFHAKSNQLPALLILITAFGFGAAQPKHAWRWAICIGIGVPIIEIVGRSMGCNPYPIEPNVFASFLALIPGFVGAYMGSITRRTVAAIQ